MKTLLHSLHKTPLLHFTLIMSVKLLSMFTLMLVVFNASLAAAQPAAPSAALDDPTAFLSVIFDAVKNKSWGALAAAVLVLLVALFRAFGKKVHELIPDSSPFDKPFYFLLETKLGGWLLNTLTATAGGFGTALLAHQTIDFPLVRTIIGVSLSAAGIWGAVKDVMDHFGKATPPAADAAVAAGGAAAADPSKQLNG